MGPPEASAGCQLVGTPDPTGLSVPVACWQLQRRMLAARTAAERQHTEDLAHAVAGQGGCVVTH
jgi:hypothetical protein